MKVKFLIGANAYACVEQANGRRTDFLLSPGRKASKSLREYAEERRADAARIISMADLAEQAATVLEGEGK